MSRWALLGGALCVSMAVVLATGCGGAPDQPSGAAAPIASATAPANTADGPGTITGTITFEGTPPPARPLPMDSDPLCIPGPGAMSELLVVGSGNGLKNVFVYVKEGLGARTYAPPAAPVRLDQKGCQYLPHVFGVQAGQTFVISNSDPLIHNVHALPKANREFNFGQPAKVPPVPRVFDQPEIGVPIRCDVHGWMNAYVNVVPHPFFAVTAEDGRFEIKGLPAGVYTLEVWHERLGTQSQSVTVDGATPATITVTFKAAM